MIQLIDIQTGDRFDLPNDFKISVSETNPMLSDQGSASLPIRLENFGRNKKLFNHLHRFDITTKPRKTVDILLTNGLYQMKGVLNILSLDDKTGIIECVIVLGESTLYDGMKDVTMQHVFENKKREDYKHLPESQRVQAWIDHLDKVMCDDIVDDFNVYTVCCGINYDNSGSIFYDFINHQALESAYVNKITKSSASGNYYALSGNNTYPSQINGVNVNIPKGYGVSPFLKFNYVLKEIFAYFNYRLNEDYLEKYPDFENLNVLNNTYDSIMYGELYYGQLVPTCTVLDYLESIRYTFGIEFIRSRHSNEIKIEFYTNIINLNNEFQKLNLTSKNHITLNDSKNLKLITQHNIKPVTETGSFQYYQDLLKLPNDYFDNLGKLNFDGIGLKIYRPGSPGKSYISGDALDWYNAAAFQEDDIKESKRDTVHMIYIDMRAFHSPNVTPSMPIKKNVPYVGIPRKLNSDILDVDGKPIKETLESKCPIMFAFARGRHQYDASYYNFNINNHYFYGSTHCYDSIGQVVVSNGFNLNFGGERGLYNTFWKAYDGFLKNGIYTIKVKIKLDPYEVMNFDMLKLYSVNNQVMLCRSLKYEVTHSGIEVVEAEFVSLKQYTEDVLSAPRRVIYF